MKKETQASKFEGVLKGRPIRTIDDAADALAMALCKLCGIEPIDSTDGSPNWWLFSNDAKRICQDLGRRMKPWWYEQGGPTNPPDGAPASEKKPGGTP